MIAIDTNVLLRYLLNDDPKQAKKAGALINGQDTVLITDVVLVETIWTLKGKKYQLSKPELALVIDCLFKEPTILFEHGQTVWAALNDFRYAKPVNGKELDFADALIANKAKHLAYTQSQRLVGVYTFDQAAAGMVGMVLVN